jgi:hypothetical protein
VSTKGVQLDPKNIDVILQLERPETAGDLIQILGLSGWMTISIPYISTIVAPLRELHTYAVQQCESAKVNKLNKFKLSKLWTPIHTKAFTDLKEAIRNRILIAHRDYNKVLTVYTDASSKIGYAGAVFQVSPEDLKNPPHLRNNEPLGFCGGTWSDTEKRWPIIELEAYALFLTVKRFNHFLLDGSQVRFHLDNQSLVFIFNPLSDYISSKLGPGQNRLYRWAELLMTIPYEIQFIPGGENVVADVISRTRIAWTTPDENKDPEIILESNVQARIVSSQLYTISTTDLTHNLWNYNSPTWLQPTLQQIRDIAGNDGELNEEFLELASKENATFDYHDRVFKVQNRVLIPSNTVLRTSLIITAHNGISGHKGVDRTVQLLATVVYWPEMKQDVRNFISNCLHCLSSSGSFPKRPFGETLQPSARLDVLCTDYVHMGPDVSSKYNKILVLMDKLSGHVVLRPVASENASEAVEHFLYWFAEYGIPKIIVSDKGPGYSSTLFENLVSYLGINHHFVSAGSHWANGSVERINSVIGRTMRSLLSENGLQEDNWIHLLPLVTFSINHSSTRTLAGLAPITILAGLEPSGNMLKFLDPSTPQLQNIAWDNHQLQQFAMDLQTSNRNREIMIEDHRQKLIYKTLSSRLTQHGVQEINFDVDDWVMVLNHSNTKLSPRIIGPAKIIQQTVPEHKLLWDIEFITTPGKIKTVHIARMKLFDLATMHLTEALLDQARLYAQSKFEFEKLLEIRPSAKSWQILVKWKGFDQEDCTWQDIVPLAQDAPTAVRNFLQTNPAGIPLTENKKLFKRLKL